MKIKYNYIIVILLIFIILWALFYFYWYKKYEYFESSQKIWAMSFGGGGQNYYDALNRIKNEIKQTNVFDEIISLTDEDLKKDQEFWEKHGNFIEDNKRGYGYWLWKPYLIMKTMENMNYNDILFYIDSGCEISEYNQNEYDILQNMIRNCNNYDLLYTLTCCDEKMYTKMDLFKYMDLIDDKVMNSIMHQATIVIIKKSDITVDFIKDWYKISCNYHMIDDSPSILPNDSSFIDHRHDQSVFSLLLNTSKYNKLNTENNIIYDSYPILLSRKRNG